VAGLIWGIIFSIPPILVGIFIQERPFSDDDEDRMQSVIRGDTGASRVAANADAREDYLLLLKASDPSARTCCFKCKGVLSSVFGMFARVFGTLKNRAYLYVTLVFFFAWTCVQFLQNVMYLHTKYVTHLQDHFQWILLILQVRHAPMRDRSIACLLG
jgi:Na+/melibiose symporter-like transporter